MFRDQTGLSVTPHLWTSIQKALDNSEYFVLMASPEAARSPWVNREIEHWVATKPADRILPVVTDGEWQWDPVNKDFHESSTSVPPALCGVFAEEPLYLDLRWARHEQHLSLRHSRFRDAIAQLAAPMHGVSKDDLEGEDVRQHRRAGRLRLAAVAALVVLTVLASTTGMAAVRNAAQANAAAVEARAQEQEASVQRGSAAKFADDARKQQTKTREQEQRAERAAADADRLEQTVAEQRGLAADASAEVKRQLAKASTAAARARQQERLARRQSALARESAKEMRRQQQRAKEQEKIAHEQQRLAAEAGADAGAQKRIAEEQRRLAADAAELAREQEKIAKEQEKQAKAASAEAARQMRVAIGRRLVNEAQATLDDDPQLALRLGIAAQKVHPQVETTREVAHLVTSTRHVGTINDTRAVAYGPGNLLATVNRDATLSLWNTTDRAHGVRLSTFGKIVEREDSDFHLRFAMDLSPDGRTLALVGPATTTLWDISVPARPEQIATLPGAGRQYFSVAFSPDRRTLVTGDHLENMGYGTLWDISDRRRPKELRRLTGNRNMPDTNFVFSPDGRTLVAANQETIIWDIADRTRPVQRGMIPSTEVRYAMAFSPTENVLAIGKQRDLALYDLTDPAKPKLTRTLSKDDHSYFAMTYSANGRVLAASSSNGTATLWEINKDLQRLLGTVPAHTSVNSVALSRDGLTLATADNAGTATLWNVAEFGTPGRRVSMRTGYNYAPAVHHSRDGRSMTVVGDDGMASWWDVTDPDRPVLRQRSRVHAADNIEAAVISPDGRTVVAGGYDGMVMLVDVSDPSAPAPFASTYLKDFNSLALSPDGHVLAIGHGDQRILWGLTGHAPPKPMATLTIGTTLSGPMKFSPDGRTLAVTTGKTVRLWDVSRPKAAKQLSTLVGHGYWVSSLTFGPDGHTVATSSEDRTAMLWDVTDPAGPVRLSILDGHAQGVGAVAFSADGRTLATGDHGSWVTVWDVAEPSSPIGLAKIQLRLGDNPADLEFGRDGAGLYAGTRTSEGFTVEVLGLAELNGMRSDPAKFACTLVDGGLTRAEWARHIPLPYEATC
ncbi:TIR domain-containing protein [Actinoplanes sp. NPDC051633]|uniref:TIR domain-containing protein n=1 Tax=Actinoplanes sp. NPDC051633 TaxID=3155670 RepID=UPI00341AA0FC